MIYVYTDPDRKHLEVIAALVKSGDDFTLLKTETVDAKKDATAYWCLNSDIAKAWDIAGVPKHDLDLSKSAERRDTNSVKPEKSGPSAKRAVEVSS